MTVLLRKTRGFLRDVSFKRDLQNFLSRLEIPHLDVASRTIVFNTVRANTANVHLISDLLLGYMLAKNGAKVYILLDDGVLEHWDSVQLYRSVGQPLSKMRSPYLRHYLKARAMAIAKVFQTPGLQVLWYSQLLPEGVNDVLDEGDKAYARMSTNRYFESGEFSENDSEQQAYYRVSLKNASCSKAIGRLAVERLHADVFASSHGIYSTWGPAYRHAKALGIVTRLYAQHPYRFGGVVIFDTPAGSFDRKAIDNYLDNASFNEEQRRRTRDYLNQRFTHTASDTREYFSGLSLQNASLLPDAGGDRYEYTFGLFPNVAWDAIGEHLQAVYSSVIDWIVDTAKTIGKQKKHRLIIRFHPAENTRFSGTNPTDQIVRDIYPEIAKLENVSLILPDEKVDSYALLREQCDVALVYSGTIGAEAQMFDVPVVAVAAGRFSERFTHQVADSDAYRAILKSPQRVIQDFQANRENIIEALLKYHYFINEEHFYRLPVLSGKGRYVISGPDLRAQDLPDPVDMKKTLMRISGIGGGAGDTL